MRCGMNFTKFAQFFGQFLRIFHVENVIKADTFLDVPWGLGGLPQFRFLGFPIRHSTDATEHRLLRRFAKLVKFAYI